MKASEKQERFLTTVVDNLKIPTIAQIKALELFLKISSDKINSEEKDLIELTLNSCNNMQSMLDNFSFAVKINSEKLNLDYEYFNFKQVVDDILKEMNILFKYLELKINFSPKSDIEIFADKVKIKKAVENTLYYAVNSAVKNSTVNINIIKNDRGIKFETVTNAFNENNEEINSIFKQGDVTMPKNIGLFILKEIVKSHFGKIIFKNSDNNINTIGFWLPLR